MIFKETDSGDYRIEADNGMSIASFSFSINVEVPPSSPSMPDILDLAPTGHISIISATDLFHFIAVPEPRSVL